MRKFAICVTDENKNLEEREFSAEETLTITPKSVTTIIY